MPVPDAVAAMVAPQPISVIATWVSIVLALAGLGWGVWRLVRTGEPMALFLLAGGAVASLLEPLYDVTALIWHPVIGQWTAFHLFGRAIPMLMPAGWCWNVGGGGAAVWLGFRSGRIGAQTIWLWFAGAVALNMAFEIPGTSLGVYTYYGHQPLPLTSGHYSLAIAFANGAAAITIGLLAWRLTPLFRSGASAWLLGAFITPFGFWIGAGPGWAPVMMAAQSTGWPRWAVTAMGGVSIALTLGLIQTYSRIIGLGAAQPRGAEAPQAVTWRTAPAR